MVDFTTFKFPAPDYDNPVTIADGDATYTVTGDGFMHVNLTVDTSGFHSCYVKVNNREVMGLLFAGNTGGYNIQSNGMFPVRTGDVVTFVKTDGANCNFTNKVFYPVVWV